MEKLKNKISFVVPVYQSDKTINRLVSEINKVMREIPEPFEVILIDDRSTDDGWKIMQEISELQNNIKSVRLSRNYGQHPAIMAGLSLVTGDWIVVMDCDLQDQPKEVLKLYNKAQEGFDAVLARRKKRKDGFLKKVSSFLFSKIYSFFTDTQYDNEIANFGIYNRKVINGILKISDNIKFFPLFVKLVGFNVTSIEVEHASRPEGRTSYSYSKLLKMAFNTIISFSNKPLKLFVKGGITISFISILFGIYNLYLTLTDQIIVSGYSSIIISIWFLSGIIITTIGVCGIYIGKIFDQTKNRPVFIIDEIK